MESTSSKIMLNDRIGACALSVDLSEEKDDFSSQAIVYAYGVSVGYVNAGITL